MVKLLSDEALQECVAKARSMVPAYGSGAAEHWKAEYRAIAQEAQRDTLRQIVDEITREMPHITRYGALAYLRDLTRELKKQAEMA